MRWTKAVGAILAVAVLGLGAISSRSALISERTIPPAVLLEDAGNADDPDRRGGTSRSTTRDRAGNGDGPSRPDPGTEHEGTSQAARPVPPIPACPAGEDTEDGEDADDECDDNADDPDEDDDGG